MNATVDKVAASQSAALVGFPFELPAMPKFELPKFDLPTMGIPEAVREAAEKGLAQARGAYEKAKSAATEASQVLEDACASGAKGALACNRQAIEAARANVNAAFDFALALTAAKSLSEVFELSAAYARDQLDTAVAQADEFIALARASASDAVEPIKAGVSKAFAKAA